MDTSPKHRNFGQLLASYRKAKKISQMELAERSGLSRNGIADLERGARSRPRRETRELLAEALGLTSVQRNALELAAKQGPASPGGAAPWSSPPELVGRGLERASIQDILTGRSSAHGSLEGAAGLGKTSLMLWAGHEAAESGWAVHYARCHRWSTQELFAPLTYLAESPLVSWSSDVRGDEQHWHAGQMDRARSTLREEFARWLESSGGPSGTLLLLDDMQWAGDSTIQILSTLANYPWKTPFRLFVSYRPTDIAPGGALLTLLLDLEREGRLNRMPLLPLEDQDARELWNKGRASAGNPGTTDTSALSLAQGSPYFILQFAGSSEKPGIPRAVSDLILQQHEELSLAAREFLGLVVVADMVIEPQTLEAAARAGGQDSREVGKALEELKRRQFLIEQEGGYACAHDLTRDLVLEHMGPHLKRDRHQAVGLALEPAYRHAHPEVLAWHFFEAQSPEKAVFYYREAAEKAARFFSYVEAQEYYRKALDCLPQDGAPRERPLLRQALARVLMIDGRCEEAIPFLEQALEEVRAAGELAAQVPILEALLSADTKVGRVESGIERGARFLPVLKTLPHSPDTVHFLASLAYLYYVAQDFKAQEETIRWAETLLPEIADRHAQLRVFEGLALRLTTEGRYEEAADMTLDHVLPFLEAIGDQHRHLVAMLNLSSTLLMLGDFVRERELLDLSLAKARSMGLGRPLGFARMLSMNLGYETGDWDRALALADSPLGDRDRALVDFSAAVLLEAARIWFLRGDVPRAERLFAEGFSGHGLVGSYPLLRATLEGETALLQGRPEAALTALKPLTEPPWDGVSGMGDWEAMLGCAAALTHDLEGGRRRVAEAEAAAREAKTVPVLSDTLRFGGWIELNAGDPERAAEKLEEALAIEGRLSRPYNRAKILGLLALVREEGGGTAELLWEEALLLCAGLGEVVWKTQISNHLARQGRGYRSFFAGSSNR